MSVANTPQQWFDVASERASDADAMLYSRNHSNGPVYMAGWAIECALNGYLAKCGISRPRPRKGYAHHDLRRLWEAAGLRLRDLSDPKGHKSWLLDSWGTHLRYDTEHNLPLTNADVVQAARQLTGFLRKIVRRKRGRR